MATDLGSLAAQEPFGVYVHWPFCLSKCPYCDFNSYAGEKVDPDRWRAALIADLDWFYARTGPRTVSSVFFGGGTPSLMPPALTEALIEHIDRRWGLSSDVEISLEANPTTAELSRFSDFRRAGVNRLSLGVQALDDESLKKLGRRHSAGEAIAAIEMARALFPRLSFDLIYARPGQTPEEWRTELAFALALAADHLSLYQLTISPGTGFFAPAQKGELVLPSPGLAADLYLLTDDLCADAGLPAYEVSNYARPGAACRGNLLYWRGDDYVGVGPGAHGRLRLSDRDEFWRATAFFETPAPKDWLAQVEEKGCGIQEQETLSQKQRAWELAMMGLRLIDGVDERRFQWRSGVALAEILDPDALAELTAAGLLAQGGGALRATRRGRLVLDALTEKLLA